MRFLPLMPLLHFSQELKSYLRVIRIRYTSEMNLVPVVGHSKRILHSEVAARRSRAREEALGAFLNTLSPVSTLQEWL